MLVDLGFDVCGVSIFARENAEEILANILHFTDYCTSCTSRKNETTMPNKFRCVVECFPTEIFSPSNPQRLYGKGARSAKTFIHPRGMDIKRAINVGQRFSFFSFGERCLFIVHHIRWSCCSGQHLVCFAKVCFYPEGDFRCSLTT